MWYMHYGLHIPITQCVLKCTKFPGKQANGYMFKTNCSSLEHWYNKLGDGFNKKMGKKKYKFPMFHNEFFAFSKQLKFCPRYFIFPIKQEDICDYNPRCFMFSGLMLDRIRMNLFSDITKQTTDSAKKDLFSKTQDERIYLYKGYLQDYSWKKRIADTKKTLQSHHFI